MKKKETQGINVKKSENFSEWYVQAIQKAGLIEYTSVSGCMIFRPYSYAIWEKVRDFFDARIKKMGVKNAYFPLLIPEHLLNKEAEHIEGFSPEVAWVTEAGKTKLNERLAIRPTSETIMYEAYRKWIRSWKDLPLKINQWCNIVRWEFKNPVPFLRTREFLWQEGHSAFATREEAVRETYDILDLYEELFEKVYAVPVLKGIKSEKEKFAGAEYTLSIETLLPSGKAIQCATSHCLGQKFSKAFDIKYLDEEENKQYVWQTSWGVSTRSMGIMIAVHGDDKGIVLPPRVAPNKVVIVPILFKKDKDKILKAALNVYRKLKKFDAILDDREDYSPGWKYNEWELKGIPIRIEIGPKDIKKKQVILVRRDTNEKRAVKIEDIKEEVEKTLEKIQDNLYRKAKKVLESSIVKVKNVEELKKAVNSGKIGKAKWCGDKECEDWIKDKTGGAKSLNMELGEVRGKCFHCGRNSLRVAYFGKSY
jgi:prolyl-tRNA synthetase